MYKLLFQSQSLECMNINMDGAFLLVQAIHSAMYSVIGLLLTLPVVTNVNTSKLTNFFSPFPAKFDENDFSA